MGKLRTLFACLAVGFLLFYTDARTPAPLPASAPPTEFAAGRALSDIAVMGQIPHPIGSPANQQVRDYLLQRMTALGLSPVIQRDQSHIQRNRAGETFISGGDVENIIGVLPGRERSLRALTLMAHYDSVQGSPGAADDITGVASILEIVRAIKASGAPIRDVMVVITDGEEAGLLGATAFFADHPLASHVGFIMNLEARGGGGRAAMFETGTDNGGAIDLYRHTAVRPSANSLSVFLYKLLPNDTDYSVAKPRGIAGLNFAFIGKQFDYHSPSSTVTVLDQGSVQNIGEQVLGPARALAFSATLPARTPDAVYGQVIQNLIIAYPAWGGWLLLIAIAVLIGIAASRARRLGPLLWIDLARGAGAGLLLLVGGAAVLHLTRLATGYGFGWIAGRPLLARFPVYEAAMAISGLASVMLAAFAMARGPMRRAGAVLLLVIGAASSLFGGFDLVGLVEGVIAAVLALIVLGRPTGFFSGWLGLLASGFLAALALQIWAPTAALTIAWPLAAAAGCAALTAAPQGRRPIGWLIALLLIALSMAWLGALFHNLLQGLDVPELPALIVWLAAFSLWILVWPDAEDPPRAALTPGAVLLVGGLGAALWLHATSPYSPRHPEVAMPLYVIDHDTGKAWRTSPFKPNPWVREVLDADGGAISRRRMPTFNGPVWAAPATPVVAQAPDMAVSRLANGVISLHAAAPADQVLNVTLNVGGGVTGQASLNGRPITLPTKPDAKVFIRWVAAPEGFTLSFKPSGPGALNVGYAAYRRQWPADAKPLPPLPPDMMDWDMFGSTVVAGTMNVKW
jgi:hypothetical protein